MLRQHNLDDERFAGIAEQARMKIAEYFPAWSDLNTHDPGVTLIDLFAWLTEQQRFHMDQSEEALPFFPLLGMALRRASAAETDVEMPGGFPPELIPARTPLYAEDVRFETIKDIPYGGNPTNVRIIQRESVRTPLLLGNAPGFPGTRFVADTRGQIILHESFSLTVGGRAWSPVDDFRASRPCDTHYTLNDETGEVLFGDGIQGTIPIGEVVITEMALTLGPRGNIAANQITGLGGLPVSQPNAAEGGAARESVSDALERTHTEHRWAVTAGDIEQIVMETPGLEIERIRAYAAEPSPRAGKPRTVCIAVMLKNGILTDEIKNIIREHLEPYRLVCRDFHITAPKIVRVSLTLELRAGPHGAMFREELEESLRTFFEKRFGILGMSLRISELRTFVASIPGVLDIPRCAFRVYEGARTSADGDIELLPDSIAMLEDVSLRIRDTV